MPRQSPAGAIRTGNPHDFDGAAVALAVQPDPAEFTTMLIKVYGGTAAQQEDGLCDTCRYSRIIRGRRLEEEVVFCGAIAMESVRITFKVTACTDYVDEREPTYHELLEKAWILRPSTKRRPAGFVRATDLSADEARRCFADPTELD